MHGEGGCRKSRGARETGLCAWVGRLAWGRYCVPGEMLPGRGQKDVDFVKRRKAVLGKEKPGAGSTVVGGKQERNTQRMHSIGHQFECKTRSDGGKMRGIQKTLGGGGKRTNP